MVLVVHWYFKLLVSNMPNPSYTIIVVLLLFAYVLFPLVPNATVGAELSIKKTTPPVMVVFPRLSLASTHRYFGPDSVIVIATPFVNGVLKLSSLG